MAIGDRLHLAQKKDIPVLATQNNSGTITASDFEKLQSITYGANKYVHPVGSGNNHVPSGGSSRNILMYNSSGEAKWVANDADSLGSVVPSGYARAYTGSYSFVGTQKAITTAEFINILTSLGAFSQSYWITRGSWAHAYNAYINDTGLGFNVHLSGATVEVMGVPAHYTIRIHAPISNSGGYKEDLVYVNNSGNQGWRRLFNNQNSTAIKVQSTAPTDTTALWCY